MNVDTDNPDVLDSRRNEKERDASLDAVELRALLNEAIKIKRNHESFIGRLKAAISKF